MAGNWQTEFPQLGSTDIWDVIEAAKTIVLDREATLALADSYGMTVVALPG